MSQSKNRQSNFELMRIISMLLITVYHIFEHSIDTAENLPIANRLLTYFMLHTGKIGVLCFIFTTGYFLHQTKFSWKKVVLLIIECEFYMLIGVIISTINNPTDLRSNLQYLYAPVSNNYYWFLTAYIIAYMLTPYLQVLTKHIDRKQFKTLLAILISVYSIIPTFVIGYIFNVNSEGVEIFSTIVWFITCELIGCYIKTYDIIKTIKSRWAYMRFILYGLMIILIQIMIFGLSESPSRNPTLLKRFNSPPILLISLGFFLFFTKCNIPYNTIINKMAKCTLGVYLLQDCPLLRFYIWNDIFKFNILSTSSLFVLFLLIIEATSIVFALGVCVELFRQQIEKFLCLIFEPIIRRQIQRSNG